jgi:hypothetical protein
MSTNVSKNTNFKKIAGGDRLFDTKGRADGHAWQGTFPQQLCERADFFFQSRL